MRVWIIIAIAASGCLRTTAYHCDSSDQCGAGGTCQSSVGFCSFADPECGQRFGPQAGQYANTCVTPEQGIDAAIDSKIPMIDGPPGSHCPTGYNTIPNGTAGHRYKLSPLNDTWMQQVTACGSQFTYLAIPNDPTELGALDTFIGLEPDYWVGIGDAGAEGTFVTVKGDPATYLPWQAPAPDNSGPGPENCVDVITAAAMFDDSKCNIQFAAICECDP
jgi:hypothetical protein